jgi:amino acid transporter
MILHMSDRNLFAFNICGLLCAVTQLISSTVVTSRFIFSLARDHGLPFSKLLSKTNKYKQPWAAELAVILSLYAAIAAWWVNQTRYYNVVQAFQFWFMPMSYVRKLPSEV